MYMYMYIYIYIHIYIYIYIHIYNKKKSKSKCSDYRPIFVLPNIDRIPEKSCITSFTLSLFTLIYSF